MSGLMARANRQPGRKAVTKLFTIRTSCRLMSFVVTAILKAEVS
jgi:hypothetical protein